MPEAAGEKTNNVPANAGTRMRVARLFGPFLTLLQRMRSWEL
jgi:hypothetical protein